MLGAGVAVMVIADAVLLRLSFQGLAGLVRRMETLDLLRTGERLPDTGGRGDAGADRRLQHHARPAGGRTQGQHTPRGVALEGERRRIGQELHDEIGQRLTGILLQLGRIRDEAPDARCARSGGIQEEARADAGRGRRAGLAAAPRHPRRPGAAQRARRAGRHLREHSTARGRADLPARLPPMAAEVELAVYRIAQEALTNAVRHAGAPNIALDASGRERPARPRRSPTTGAACPPTTDEGPGMRGMRERALLIGGRLRIDARARGVRARRGRVDVPRDAPAREPCRSPTRPAILIADDHAVVREGLKAVLEREPDLQVVAEAADGLDAVAAGRRGDIDLAILDVAMPGMTGLQAAREITRRRGPADPDAVDVRPRAVLLRGPGRRRRRLRAQAPGRPRHRRRLPGRAARRAVHLPRSDERAHARLPRPGAASARTRTAHPTRGRRRRSSSPRVTPPRRSRRASRSAPRPSSGTAPQDAVALHRDRLRPTMPADPVRRSEGAEAPPGAVAVTRGEADEVLAAGERVGRARHRLDGQCGPVEVGFGPDRPARRSNPSRRTSFSATGSNRSASTSSHASAGSVSVQSSTVPGPATR